MIFVIAVYLVIVPLIILLVTSLNYRDSIFCFFIVLTTSGFVYLSSILLLLYILYGNIVRGHISARSKILSMLFFLAVTCIELLGNSNEFVISEYIQIIVVGILLILIRGVKLGSNSAISYGFLIGSILVSMNVLIESLVMGNFSQETFKFFSISSTFNYTVYFLYAGFIIAPEILRLNMILRLLALLLYSVAAYLLESRFGFLIGFLAFSYINVNIRLNLRSLSIISLLVLACFGLVSSSILDRSDPNDIVYSLINFETNTSNLERINMLVFSFSSLTIFPLGVGLGNSHLQLSVLGFDHPHAHNMLANWIYELGYLGVLLYFAFLFYLIRMYFARGKGYSKKFIISLVGYMILMSMVSALQYNILVSLITYLVVLQLTSMSKNEECV